MTAPDIDALLMSLDAQARTRYPFAGIGIHDELQLELLREIVRRWMEKRK
jgi:hypothetical protein